MSQISETGLTVAYVRLSKAVGLFLIVIQSIVVCCQFTKQGVGVHIEFSPLICFAVPVYEIFPSL